MNEIQLFNNPEFGEIRTLKTNDGTVLFCGKDVAMALGYERTADAIRKHCKGVAKIETPTKGGIQEMAFIPESDVYRLAFGSKLESAERFTDWVVEEVLPAIRQHGKYDIKDSYMIDDPVERAQRWIEEQQELRGQIKALEVQAEEDKPKVLFADAVSASKTSILIGELAKLLKQNGYDTGQKRLFQWMRENGYLIKGGSSKNMPTQRSMNMGLFEIKETIVAHTDHTTVNKTVKVTGKGQQYFINLFLDDDSDGTDYDTE